MKRVGFGICLAMAAALFTQAAQAQTPVEGLRDALRLDSAGTAPTPRPYSLWTPAALRTALLEGPLRSGTLPTGFALQALEVRKPALAERAAGMAYRIDVILNGPTRAQSITFRIYDTPEAAATALQDKTLGDRGVTLTRETLEAAMVPRAADGVNTQCARVRSASYADLVFMRCYRMVLDLPLIASGAIGVGDYSLTDASGAINTAALDSEMRPATILLMAAAAQVQTMVVADPDGERAYMRDMIKSQPDGPSKPEPASAKKKKKKDKD